MSYSIIAAIGKNNELGKNNQLIWHLTNDLKFLKKQQLVKLLLWEVFNLNLFLVCFQIESILFYLVVKIFLKK